MGTSGSIKFKKGSKYSFKIQNTPAIKLSFIDKDGTEMLNYEVEGAEKPKAIVTLLDHSADETELLMLLVLGCHCFKEIV